MKITEGKIQQGDTENKKWGGKKKKGIVKNESTACFVHRRNI